MVVLQVDSIWTGAGVAGGGITQLFFKNPSADAQACCDAVQDFWDAILPQVSSQCSVRTGTAVKVYNETDGELLSVQATSSLGDTPGGSANHMLPRSTQGLIRWQTAAVVNNRVLTGRTFLPGMIEDNNFSPGQPAGGLPGAVATAAAGLIGDASGEFAVWHRPIAGSGGQVEAVVAHSLWDQWAVLRSRRD